MGYLVYLLFVTKVLLISIIDIRICRYTRIQKLVTTKNQEMKKRKFKLLVCLIIIPSYFIHAQNFLLSPGDFYNEPREYIINLIDVVRKSPAYSEELILEEYGENISIEKYSESPNDYILFSHKHIPKFPLLKIQTRVESGIVWSTTMRVPPSIDTNRILREMGFVYVETVKEEDHYRIVFTSEGTTNPVVGLAFYDIIIQVLKYSSGDTYVQASTYLDDELINGSRKKK